ncbi:hypothetical protein [Pendulispora albinea]|uniref:Uncharacterized protein n=1 Tax=Pendulispora albinea TaxID=2741071 RepID=A0ABZ2LYJ4_9BACT
MSEPHVKKLAFDALSPVLAELSVPEGPHDFGVRTSGWPAVHDIGSYGAPRWRIRQPMAPDDGWELETLPSGGLLPARPVPEDFEWAYLTWAEGSRAEAGAAVLHALPPGRYLLVRSSLEPRRGASVLLGNERVPSPANTRVLVDAGSFYAMLVGPESDAPPRTTHPLVGLVALNYTGGPFVHGALFFDALAREASEENEAAPDAPGDRVLVIPRTGELLIDALAEFSKDRTERDKSAWRDTRAHELARVLTGIE